MIRGERVTLRQWTDADLAPFAAMGVDPEVMRHMRSPLTRDESDALVARLRGQIDAEGFGLWAIDVPGLGFAGFVGLAKVPIELSLPGLDTAPYDIGWRLARAAWGRGYATEGAMLALRYGFDEAKLPRIVSFAALGNRASIAVMERIGLTRHGEFDHPRLPPEHRSYRHVMYAKERP
jgi:RimJ/RimL family protein N-acetyltransferase